MSGPNRTSAREDELATVWAGVRPRLVRVAYAILGTVGDAEDAVADTWPKLVAADARERVLDVGAWGTVAVARAALDVYRSARRRREVYVGEWLPEPVVGALRAPEGGADPADRVTLEESVSFAMLVVLESLSPAERTSWVLHDVFGLAFDEVAGAVGRSPSAVRQLATRARGHLRERAPRFPVDPVGHADAVGRFLAAAAGGRLEDLMTVLDPDVVLTADGGGVVSSARRPVFGADRVGRFVLGILAKVADDERVEVVEVNGAGGIAVLRGDELTGVVSLTVVDGLIARVDIVRAPDKLRAGFGAGGRS